MNYWFIVNITQRLALFQDARKNLLVLPAQFVVLNHTDDGQKNLLSDFEANDVANVEQVVSQERQSSAHVGLHVRVLREVNHVL